jgi:stress response protein SCP2
MSAPRPARSTDASAITVGADGRVPSDKHFVFFNN